MFWFITFPKRQLRIIKSLPPWVCWPGRRSQWQVAITAVPPLLDFWPAPSHSVRNWESDGVRLALPVCCRRAVPPPSTPCAPLRILACCACLPTCLGPRSHAAVAQGVHRRRPERDIAECARVGGPLHDQPGRPGAAPHAPRPTPSLAVVPYLLLHLCSCCKGRAATRVLQALAPACDSCCEQVALFTVLHPSPESELKAGVGAAAGGVRTAPIPVKVRLTVAAGPCDPPCRAGRMLCMACISRPDGSLADGRQPSAILTHHPQPRPGQGGAGPGAAEQAPAPTHLAHKCKSLLHVCGFAPRPAGCPRWRRTPGSWSRPRPSWRGASRRWWRRACRQGRWRRARWLRWATLPT